LGWAAEHASDEVLRDIARLRLAGVLADNNAAEEALKQLAIEPTPAFAARFAELRGDILASQGKATEARAEYERAMAKAGEMDATGAGAEQRRNAYRDMLKAKLEAVGGGAK